MLSFLIAGFVGGILRGVMGIVKYSLSYKDVNLRPWYFGGTVLVAGIIGGTAAWITHDLGIGFLGIEKLSPAIALIIGYAGADFLENIGKIITKKATLFE